MRDLQRHVYRRGDAMAAAVAAAVAVAHHTAKEKGLLGVMKSAKKLTKAERRELGMRGMVVASAGAGNSVRIWWDAQKVERIQNGAPGEKMPKHGGWNPRVLERLDHPGFITSMRCGIGLQDVWIIKLRDGWEVALHRDCLYKSMYPQLATFLYGCLYGKPVEKTHSLGHNLKGLPSSLRLRVAAFLFHEPKPALQDYVRQSFEKATEKLLLPTLAWCPVKKKPLYKPAEPLDGVSVPKREFKKILGSIGTPSKHSEAVAKAMGPEEAAPVSWADILKHHKAAIGAPAPAPGDAAAAKPAGTAAAKSSTAPARSASAASTTASAAASAVKAATAKPAVKSSGIVAAMKSAAAAKTATGGSGIVAAMKSAAAAGGVSKGPVPSAPAKAADAAGERRGSVPVSVVAPKKTPAPGGTSSTVTASKGADTGPKTPAAKGADGAKSQPATPRDTAKDVKPADKKEEPKAEPPVKVDQVIRRGDPFVPLFALTEHCDQLQQRVDMLEQQARDDHAVKRQLREKITAMHWERSPQRDAAGRAWGGHNEHDGGVYNSEADHGEQFSVTVKLIASKHQKAPYISVPAYPLEPIRSFLERVQKYTGVPVGRQVLGVASGARVRRLPVAQLTGKGTLGTTVAQMGLSGRSGLVLAEAGPVTLDIRVSHVQSVRLKAYPDERVGTVKELLMQKSGAGGAHMGLFLGGTELPDDTTLWEGGLRTGTVTLALQRVRNTVQIAYQKPAPAGHTTNASTPDAPPLAHYQFDFNPQTDTTSVLKQKVAAKCSVDEVNLYVRGGSGAPVPDGVRLAAMECRAFVAVPSNARAQMSSLTRKIHEIKGVVQTLAADTTSLQSAIHMFKGGGDLPSGEDPFSPHRGPAVGGAAGSPMSAAGTAMAATTDSVNHLLGKIYNPQVPLDVVLPKSETTTAAAAAAGLAPAATATASPAMAYHRIQPYAPTFSGVAHHVLAARAMASPYRR